MVIPECTQQSSVHHFIGLHRQLDLVITKLFALTEQLLDFLQMFFALFSRHGSDVVEVILSKAVDLFQQRCNK